MLGSTHSTPVVTSQIDQIMPWDASEDPWSLDDKHGESYGKEISKGDLSI